MYIMNIKYAGKQIKATINFKNPTCHKPENFKCRVIIIIIITHVWMKKPVPHGSPRPVLIEPVLVIMPVKMSLILVSLIISKPKTTGRARLPFVQ